MPKQEVQTKFRTADEDLFYADLATRYSHRDRRRRDVDWVRTGWPTICEIARSFPSTAAFILGTGPSTEAVTLKEWEGVEKHFSIAVNQFPGWFAEKFGREWAGPLCLVSDFFEGESWKHMRELLQAYRQAGGKLLVAYEACQMEHDFCAPMKGGDLLDDPEFNITLSHAIDTGFNRSVFGACYILGLVMRHGPDKPYWSNLDRPTAKYFQNICLLGVDHGADYYPAEPRNATEGWWHFKDWAATHNIALWQCGTEAGFGWEYLPDEDKVTAMQKAGHIGPAGEGVLKKAATIPQKRLEHILSGKWAGARRRKVKR